MRTSLPSDTTPGNLRLLTLSNNNLGTAFDRYLMVLISPFLPGTKQTMQTKCYLTQGRCGERPLRGVAVRLAHVGRHLHRGQQQLRQRVPVPVQGDHHSIIIIIMMS